MARTRYTLCFSGRSNAEGLGRSEVGTSADKFPIWSTPPLHLVVASILVYFAAAAATQLTVVPSVGHIVGLFATTGMREASSAITRHTHDRMVSAPRGGNTFSIGTLWNSLRASRFLALRVPLHTHSIHQHMSALLYTPYHDVKTMEIPGSRFSET